jgi:hypothetical protein
MRNVSQLLVSILLLAAQAAPVTQQAAASSQTPVLEVVTPQIVLDTASPRALKVIPTPQVTMEDQLTTLRANQAAAAAKAKADAAIAAARAKVKVKKAVIAVVVLVPGSHTDWMAAAGIAPSDYGYVDYIVDRESGWVATKWNYAGSGAYGLGQALPATKMAKFGSDYMTDPVTQLKWANAYAVGSYGSWANAYAHWIARHSW